MCIIDEKLQCSVNAPPIVTYCDFSLQEMTVKGLEPDIQKLIAKHKAEIKKIKAMHQVILLFCSSFCLCSICCTVSLRNVFYFFRIRLEKQEVPPLA